MKITITAADLRAAMKAVARVADAKSTLPILACVRMVVEGATLRVMTTNLDTRAEAAVEGTSGEDGGCVVDAALIAAFAGRATGSIDILHSAKTERLSARAGSRFVELPTLPVDDFPVFIFAADTEMPDPPKIAGALEFVAPCVSTEDARYYLCGVHIGPNSVEATDGHKAAVVPFTGADPVFSENAILPRAMIGMICDALRAEGARFFLSPNAWRIASPGFEICGKVIDGTFPDIGRVMPKAQPRAFTAHRDEFAESILDATLGKRGKVRILRADTVDEGGGEILEIIAGGTANDDGFNGTGISEVVVTAGDEGASREAKFNSRFLSDMLSVMPPGQIECYCAPGDHASVFQPEHGDGRKFIIMQMR